MSDCTARSLLGVALVFLAITKSCHSKSLHHHGRHPKKISRGDQATSNQVTTATMLHLDTYQMFGLNLRGPFTITNNMRDELKKKLSLASKRIDCNKALLMSDGDCSAMEMLISRHLGNFYYNYNRHYDMMNSVTRSGSTLGNGIETSSSITKRSTDTPCNQGRVFDCTESKDKKDEVIQKCWLFDLYGVSQQASSLNIMQYQGNTLRWSDISKYMKDLGKKLLFKNFANTDDVENFYSQIYSEIKCEIGRINQGTRENIFNEYYRKHADLMREIHTHFHRLKSDGCYQTLLDFMNNISEVAGSDTWEDIILNHSSYKNKLDPYYNSTTKPHTHKCHLKILEEYSHVVQKRAKMIKELTDLVREKSTDSDANNFKSSFGSGILYEMTDKIFAYMARLLFKSYLMTNPEGRYPDVADEDSKVDSTCRNVLRVFTNVSSPITSPDKYWSGKIKRINRNIKNKRKKERKAS